MTGRQIGGKGPFVPSVQIVEGVAAADKEAEEEEEGNYSEGNPLVSHDLENIGVCEGDKPVHGGNKVIEVEETVNNLKSYEGGEYEVEGFPTFQDIPYRKEFESEKEGKVAPVVDGSLKTIHEVYVI